MTIDYKNNQTPHANEDPHVQCGQCGNWYSLYLNYLGHKCPKDTKHPDANSSASKTPASSKTQTSQEANS